jgi:DNA-binding CsgD family transcriptional regulator
VYLVTDESITPYFRFVILGTSIFLGISISLNAITKREVKTPKNIKTILLGISAILLGLLALNELFDAEVLIELIAYNIIYCLITYTMIYVRKVKSTDYMKHRKIYMAVICLGIIPLSISYDFFILRAGQFSVWDTNVALSLPILFISLSSIKIVSDIGRLSRLRLGRKPEIDLAAFELTQRELEVVHLLVNGVSYKLIGEQLFISLPTVKTHISNIYRKTNVNNKVALINLISQ